MNRKRCCYRFAMCIQSGREIIVNSLFLVVYGIQVYMMGFSAVGHCYADGSQIPKYDYPEKI